MSSDPISESLYPTRRLKFLLIRNEGGIWGAEPGTADVDVPVLRSTEQTIDGEWNISEPAIRGLAIAEFEKNRLIVGDVIVTKSSGSPVHIGKASLVDSHVASQGSCFSNFMQRLRPSEILDSRYLAFFLNSETCRDQFRLLSTTTTGLGNLSAEIIGEVEIPLPDVAAQQAIADYLEVEKAQIVALISAKERLLALLAEKRRALITHTVTRGLDPDVVMRDSGLPWLGAVPAHWRFAGFTKYLRSLVDYRGKTPEKVPSGVFLVTARNIKDGYIDYEASQEFVEADTYAEVMQRGKPKIGDLLLTTEAPLGQAALVDREDIALAQRVIKLDYDSGVLLNEFALAWIRSAPFQWQLNSFATGSTALGIKGERLHMLRNLLPPVAEQRAIVAHITAETARLDALAAATERTVALLKERRAALIAAAVTGEIDVGWGDNIITVEKETKVAWDELLTGGMQ